MKEANIIRAIQNRLLRLVISSIIISTIMVMAIAIISYNRFLESNSEQIMQLMCSDKKQQINEKLLNVEQSVHAIYHFAMEQLDDESMLWQDEEKLHAHMEAMTELMGTLAEYTDGARTVYYRLNPYLQQKNEGVWLIKDGKGEFTEHETTDILQYDKNDVEHVGWYYIPVEKRRATWMNPYYNKNMGEDMISYVIPVIYDGYVMGVVGMDITTELLYDNTSSVTVNETGYAFLMDGEGNFLYHPEMKSNLLSADFSAEHAYLYEKSLLSAKNNSVEKYRWEETDKRLTTQKLCNGMLFSVCMTEKEIMQPQRQMFARSIGMILLIVSVFIILTVNITKKIVGLAYKDALTDLYNNTAYRECVEMLERKIAGREELRFAIIVADINDLKKMNDTFGHECGNAFIQNAASVLRKIWSDDVIYRIGGDEFVIILMDADMEQIQEDIALLNEEIEKNSRLNQSTELCLQIAAGVSVYNPETDREYSDVFSRADSDMYEDKKRKKSEK